MRLLRRFIMALFLLLVTITLVGIFILVASTLTIDGIEYIEDILGLDICGMLTKHLKTAIRIVRTNAVTFIYAAAIIFNLLFLSIFILVYKAL
jgi:hypothetical protein